MKQKQKHPPVFRSLAWRIIALTLALWIACMGILTCCVASDMLQQLQDQLRRCLSVNVHTSQENSLSGAEEVIQIHMLGQPYFTIRLDSLFPSVYQQHLKNPVSSDDWIWGNWELQLGYEAAILLRDETKASVFRTGDYLTFTYATSENWENSNVDAAGMGYVILDKLTGGRELADRMLTEQPIGSFSSDMIFPLLRLRGYFEGNEFHPTSIDCAYTFVSGEPVHSYSVSALSEMDKQKRVQWTNLFSLSAEDGSSQEIIYAWDVGGYNCPQKAVTVNGQHFDSLSDLLAQAVDSGEPNSYNRYNLFRALLIGSVTREDDQGPYTVAVAIRCKPLQYAAVRLVAVYLISLALVALCLLLLLRRLKVHVCAPLARMADSAVFGIPVSPGAHYDEILTLEEHLADTHQTLAENKTELQQLRTALDYARDAEERRKQLISNITHELKTPLAILHSYCECLQEDLPKETQTQYLQTVLEETEKMDAMVLQMLELSRLESGKIRLASDQFSLLKLTNAVCERIKPLLEQRELKLVYGYTEDLTVTADEARMEQVITNLLSNAQKYSVHGGIIRISTYRSGSSVDFNTENTAPHLSQEALEKVFDSFYRADASRNTPGTGLGLALVKSIISLHGGTCSVKNTHQNDGAEAVQFGFTLPLK